MFDSPLALLLPPLGLISIVGFLLHQQSYRKLYLKMKDRGLVSSDYSPSPMSAVWSIGCLGYIIRLRREIGIDKLDSVEKALLNRAVYAYWIGVPAAFLMVCIIFWLNHNHPL